MEALITSIDSKYPCRTLQLRQLSALLNPDLPSPSSIILYGLEATGKSLLTKALLDASETTYSWVACHECITARHLTERIASQVKDAVQEKDGVELEKDVLGMRAENVNALAVVLGKILGIRGKEEEGGVERKHVLVLDRIDRQREAMPILLAGLARLGEFIPSLTAVFILSAPSPRLLSTSSIPHIHFPPYTKEELIHILSLTPLRLNIPPSRPPSRSPSPDTLAANDQADLAEDLFVYTRFLGTVWESLAKSTSRNILQFKSIADKMWDEFVEPIRSGEYGTRNFSQLYVRQRDMFRVERHILDEVVPSNTTTTTTTTSSGITAATTSSAAAAITSQDMMAKATHDLPYYSKLLLLASYLASYNPSRLDVQFFTKASDKRKRRRGGGAIGAGGGRKSQVRKIQRRLLGPQPFLLERMLAIFHAIVPDPVASSVDLQTQIATLTSLRLLVRASASGDPLEAGGKWRVNVGWEYVRGLARSVKFEVEGFLAEV
ncbi:origin recognition complex subunit 5 C-terminus-domain-containing protein [Tirmania nivea]|nr:origin recognition complex subunit 5 C-terminus-domain-containing protein [Tirmania nivea]